MKPIYPHQLKEPFDIAGIDQMVKSWRGTPKTKVPHAVRIAAELLDILKESERDRRMLNLKLTAQDQLFGIMKRELNNWTEIVSDEMRRLDEPEMKLAGGAA